MAKCRPLAKQKEKEKRKRKEEETLKKTKGLTSGATWTRARALNGVCLLPT